MKPELTRMQTPSESVGAMFQAPQTPRPTDTQAPADEHAPSVLDAVCTASVHAFDHPPVLRIPGTI